MILNLPSYTHVECEQIRPGKFEASIWDTNEGAPRCLALAEDDTRLSAIRSAVQTFWTRRIATAQLLAESL